MAKTSESLSNTLLFVTWTCGETTTICFLCFLTATTTTTTIPLLAKQDAKPRISLPLEDVFVDFSSHRIKLPDPYFIISTYSQTFICSSKDAKEVAFWIKAVNATKTQRMAIPENPAYEQVQANMLRYQAILVDYEEPAMSARETRFIIEVTCFNRRWRVRRFLDDMVYLNNKLRETAKDYLFPLSPDSGLKALGRLANAADGKSKKDVKRDDPAHSLPPGVHSRNPYDVARDEIQAAARYCRCLLFELTTSRHASVSQADEMLDFLEIRSLFRGVRCGSRKHVTFLKKHGINFNIRDKDGRNALHVAALAPEGGALVVDSLLSAGVAMNVQDADGNTPLLLAVMSQEQMLRHGFITSRDSLARNPKRAARASSAGSRKDVRREGSVGSRRSKSRKGSGRSVGSRKSRTSVSSTRSMGSAKSYEDRKATTAADLLANAYTSSRSNRSNNSKGGKGKSKGRGGGSSRLTAYDSVVNYGSMGKEAAKAFAIAYKSGGGGLVMAPSAEALEAQYAAGAPGEEGEEGPIKASAMDSVVPMPLRDQEDPTRFHTVAQALIVSGADTDIANNLGWTPMHYAVEAGSRYIVEALSRAGTKLNAPDKEGNSIVHRAVAAGRVEVVNYLSAKKQSVNLDLKNWKGLTPLAVACAIGHVEMANILVKAGSNQHVTDNDGHGCLYHAIQGRSGQIVDMLVSAGADMEDHDPSGATPLTLAVSLDARECVTALIMRGAKTTTNDVDGRSPCYIAIENRRIHVLEYLLTKGGVDVNAHERYMKTRTLLHHAVALGSTQALTLLIKSGANVNVRDVNGDTPLSLAVHGGKKALSLVTALLEAKASAKETDSKGATPLMGSVLVKGDTAVFKALIQAGCQVGAARKDGKTAVILASEAGDLATVEYLLRRGQKEGQKVNVDAQDGDGNTALHYAMLGGHEGLARFLHKEFSAKTNLKNKSGQTSASLATGALAKVFS